MGTGATGTSARVGVVVLDHDGGDLTLRCLRSLLATEWPAGRLEVVLVDNASLEPVTARARDEMPTVRIVRSEHNLGFAGGVNLGIEALPDVDFVALVNNDAAVEPGWLRPLVDAFADQPDLGAASPKILLADRFVEVTLSTPTTRRRWERRPLGVRLSGVEVDGRDATAACHAVRGTYGVERGGSAEPAYRWTSGEAVLLVPASRPGEQARLRLAADRPTRVTVAVGDARTELDVGTEPAWYDVRLGGTPLDIVNNVGNDLVDDGYVADRGYLARDDGAYDTPVDVFAWCGAAVLLSEAYLDDVGTMDARLFLYNEDVELSWRGRDRGWRYRTVPESVVRHVHSATSVEGSALSHYYSERNHLLVLVRHGHTGLVVRAFARYVLVTASYARRDLLSRWLRRERAHAGEVGRRLRALGGALVLTPAMIRSRLADRRRRPRTMTPASGAGRG